MAKSEDIDLAVELIEGNRPHHALEEMRKHDVGMFAVLKFLNDKDLEIKSKDISDKLGISTARMAVILKNMEKKELITKINSKSDARAISIKLSDDGKKLANIMRLNIRKTAEKIVDEFGIEHLTDLFDDMKKIKEIMKNSMENIEGEEND